MTAGQTAAVHAHGAIDIRGLTKHFGSVRAVDGIDLRVEPGEVFGFLGPNGAGKTTTIRVVLGLLRPTAGSVSVLGGDPSNPESRRRVTYLPGDLELDAKMTGRQQLELLAALRGGVDRRHIADLCDTVGLDPSRPMRELSKGNRQKVGIVQAFMGEPDLLVLDEPTSGLDPLQQQLFNDLLAQAKARGAAVFLSSHVLPEVERVADRVGIIRAGELVAVATVDDLLMNARQRFTISLTSPPDGVDFESVAGVREHDIVDGMVHVVVEGAVQPVLDVLRPFGVVRITSHDDDLDDAFLGYYR